MNIKLLWLKNGQQIICKLNELPRYDNELIYQLQTPYLVEVSPVYNKVNLIEECCEVYDDKEDVSYDMRLSEWIPLSEDTSFTIKSTEVMVMTTPIAELLEMYNEIANEKRD